MTPKKSLPIERLLGKRIWKLRRKKKLSQKQLAKESGIHASFLGCIERGEKCPTLRVLEKIRSALGVSYTQLFDFSEELDEEHPQRILEKLAKLLLSLSQQDRRLLEEILEAFERTRGAKG